MNKRVYIIVEGQTEEAFVKEILAKYLERFEIYVTPIILQTSRGHKGGFVNYEHLRRTLIPLLHSQGKDIVVSTFLDFFRCPDLPEKHLYENISDHRERVGCMEEAIKRNINDWRFFPYIQLHEFEALLFSSVKGFEKYFSEDENLQLRNIIRDFQNPEDINSTPEGAPSKRLLKIVNGYDKIIYGNIVALEIGIETIMKKCHRFRSWVETIVKKAQS